MYVVLCCIFRCPAAADLAAAERREYSNEDSRLCDRRSDPIVCCLGASHSEHVHAGRSASCRSATTCSYHSIEAVTVVDRVLLGLSSSRRDVDCRTRRPRQEKPNICKLFRARAQSSLFSRRHALPACRFHPCQNLLRLLATFSLFLLTARLPPRCAASRLFVQPHDVLLSVAMPSNRRLFESSVNLGGQTTSEYCPRDDVASGRAPLAWFYAATEGGMPQYGLPMPSLVTSGYEDKPYVFQWQGA